MGSRFYPEIRDPRMLLDVDGTAMWSVIDTDLGDVPTQLTPEQIRILSNEDDDDLGLTTGDQVSYYLVVFPEQRNMTDIYLGFEQDGAFDPVEVQVEDSANTTNGYNGDWEGGERRVVHDGSGFGVWGHVEPGDWRRYAPVAGYPDNPTKAVRIRVFPASPTTGWRLKSLHIYGQPAFGQNVHRLEIWNPDLRARVDGTHLDWGDANKPSTEDRIFLVHNVSPSRTARKVTLSVDALTEDPAKPFRRQFLLSTGGGIFNPTVLLPEIQPKTSSIPVTIRRITPKTAPEGPWAARLRARAASWAEVTA